jgi:two-component system, sensor histidine kinase and response regulator
MLRQVYANLIENALKYTGQRADTQIHVGCEQAGGRDVFFVSDKGAGFAMLYADRLFRAFPRLHGETEFEGTGIGLATVKRIVERHSGTIWAEAQADKRATFWFTPG